MNFEKGNKVKYVGTIFTKLAGETGIVVHGSVLGGLVKVDFPSSRVSYKCYKASLELIKEVKTMSFKKGDKVKVKAECVDKHCKYGGVFGAWTGEVIKSGKEPIVKFSEPVVNWVVSPNEVELIEEPLILEESFLSPGEQLDLIRTQPPVYKTVLVLADGSRVSAWARGGAGTGNHPSLDYKEGEVTRTPEGTQGINVSPEDTSKTGTPGCEGSKQEMFPGSYFAIHEAWAIGKRNTDCMGSGTWYPAILLGKELWSSKPKEPEWKDVTLECEVSMKPHLGKDSFQYIRVMHQDKYVLGLGGSYSALTTSSQYKVEVDTGMGAAGGFKVFKKSQRR